MFTLAESERALCPERCGCLEATGGLFDSGSAARPGAGRVVTDKDVDAW
jgi:hypothetical protein